MADKKLIYLIDRLLFRTEEGSISWTAEKPKQYRVDFDDFSIRVESYTTRLAEPIVELSVINEEGVEIESVTDKKIDSNARANLRKLFDSARRRALKIDEALEKILRAVG